MYWARSIGMFCFLFFLILAAYPMTSYAEPKADPITAYNPPTQFGKIGDSSLTADRGRYWRNYYRPHYYTYYPRSYYYSAYPRVYSGVNTYTPYYYNNPYYYNTYNSGYYYYPAGASFTVGW